VSSRSNVRDSWSLDWNTGEHCRRLRRPSGAVPDVGERFGVGAATRSRRDGRLGADGVERGAAPPDTAAEFIARKTAQFARERDTVSIRTKDIEGGEPGRSYRDAWTLMVDSFDPEKVVVLERLRYDGPERGQNRPGQIAIRVSYYKVGRRGNKRFRWTFGQYALSSSPEMWRSLFEQALRDGTVSADEWPWLA
jgi:hypothetical protein